MKVHVQGTAQCMWMDARVRRHKGLLCLHVQATGCWDKSDEMR